MIQQLNTDRERKSEMPFLFFVEMSLLLCYITNSYDSIKSAAEGITHAKTLETCISAICKACKNHRVAYGYRWKYKDAVKVEY